jgi:hypothetical protein
MDRDVKHALQEADDVLADLISFLTNVGEKSSAQDIPEFVDAIRDLTVAANNLGNLSRANAKVFKFPSQRDRSSKIPAALSHLRRRTMA